MMRLILSVFAVVTALLSAATLGADPCAGRTQCKSTPTFMASVTDFRQSTQGRYKVLTVTMRFENLSKAPLTLGYVADSGVAVDDRGNRYVIANDAAVRGLGVIRHSTFDPKFTLAPGETADGRFELVFEPGRALLGTRFDFDVAVREITPLAGDQFRLGREHAFTISGLGEPAGAQPAAPAVAAAAAAAPVAASPAPAADPCAGNAYCYNTGPFAVEVLRVTPSRTGGTTGDHQLQINVNVRNLSTAPVILGYQSGSNLATDELGNPYYWGRAGTHDGSFKGIGLVVPGRSADPQFVLQPGEARGATFTVRRYRTSGQIGTSYTWDVVLVQLETLPSQQVRAVRDHSLNFPNLTAGTFTSAAAASAMPATAEDAGKRLFDAILKKVTDKTN